MPHLSANTWSPSLCRWRGFTMTAGGLRLLHDLRRSLLEPARQLRPRTTRPRPTTLNHSLLVKARADELPRALKGSLCGRIRGWRSPVPG
jgi:hypothetical protein